MDNPSKLFVTIPAPSVWEEICRNEKKKSPFGEKKAPEIVDFDPAKTSPVFYGSLFGQVQSLDTDPFSVFDPAKGHPATLGFAFVDDVRIPSESKESLNQTPSEDFDAQSCPAKVFLQKCLFPVLLPGIQEMIFQARRERCFERKKTKFNACDFLTEWLYNQNPKHPERQTSPQTINEIPFCKEFSAEHPREALPLSLLLSDEQAATIIQSHWRGFKVRREPEVAALRAWQKEWNEMNQDVRNKMTKFWIHQGLDGSRSTTSLGSGEGEEKLGSALSL